MNFSRKQSRGKPYMQAALTAKLPLLPSCKLFDGRLHASCISSYMQAANYFRFEVILIVTGLAKQPQSRGFSLTSYMLGS